MKSLVAGTLVAMVMATVAVAQDADPQVTLFTNVMSSTPSMRR